MYKCQAFIEPIEFFSQSRLGALFKKKCRWKCTVQRKQFIYKQISSLTIKESRT